MRILPFIYYIIIYEYIIQVYKSLYGSCHQATKTMKYNVFVSSWLSHVQHRRQDKSALDKTLQLKDRMVMDWAIFLGGWAWKVTEENCIYSNNTSQSKKNPSDLHQMIKHGIHSQQFPTYSPKYKKNGHIFFFFWGVGGHRSRCRYAVLGGSNASKRGETQETSVAELSGVEAFDLLHECVTRPRPRWVGSW